MSSKKHSNAAGQSSRGSASKGQMRLTSYLWKKNWNAMEKLWNFFSGDLYEPWYQVSQLNPKYKMIYESRLWCSVCYSISGSELRSHWTEFFPQRKPHGHSFYRHQRHCISCVLWWVKPILFEIITDMKTRLIDKYCVATSGNKFICISLFQHLKHFVLHHQGFNPKLGGSRKWLRML